MPQYTLHYFAIRGYGELARLIFAQAGQSFTDHRITREEWPEEKKNKERFPFGVAPTLEIDGKVLPESLAIARYLASEFGLHGKNNLDRARCDGIVDVLKEIRVEMRPVTPYFLKETDEAKIAQMKADVFGGKIATKMAALEELLKSNNDGKGFLVGDSVTYADLSLIDNGYNMLDIYPAAFDKTPLLKGLYDRVMALPNIKKHCDARPVTPM